MQPIRVQRKRVKGYKMPDNTISVTRPGKFGNPFVIGEKYPTAEKALEAFRSAMMDLNSIDLSEIEYAKFRYMRDRIHDLNGKSLACFCKLDSPCHADILLELANPKNP